MWELDLLIVLTSLNGVSFFLNLWLPFDQFLRALRISLGCFAPNFLLVWNHPPPIHFPFIKTRVTPQIEKCKGLGPRRFQNWCGHWWLGMSGCGRVEGGEAAAIGALAPPVVVVTVVGTAGTAVGTAPGTGTASVGVVDSVAPMLKKILRE